MNASRPYRSKGTLRFRLALAVSLTLVISCHGVSIADTEVRKFMVEIRNEEDVPMKGLRVKCRGHSEVSNLSSESGLTELPLPPGSVPGNQMEIELDPTQVYSREWSFLSPYNGSLNVPRLATPSYFLKITLIKRNEFDAIRAKKIVTNSENIQSKIVVNTVVGQNPPPVRR